MTFFSTSYGSTLSAMMVISRCARSRSEISLPTSSGRLRASRRGPMIAVLAARTSGTVVMCSPCTNRSVLVIITTTDCLGAASAIDCGISMPLLFWMTSTSVEYTSRKATITDRMSMSGIRFSSASARCRM